jgi:hypothetical protein
MSFDYPLTEAGKIAWFSFVIDVFEDYIESYWSFTRGYDSNGDYPISFQIDYVDNQFFDDFIVEDGFRFDSSDKSYFDPCLVDTFFIKNNPTILSYLAHVSFSYRIDESNPSLVEIKMSTLWSQRYLYKTSYEVVVFNNFASDTSISLDEFIKGSLITCAA